MPPILPLDLLRLPLRLLPDVLHTQIFARVINHLLRGQRLGARLSELDGRSVCLDVHDAGTQLHFLVRNGQLVAAESPNSQVIIRGELRDFIDLATRAKDPDTLFFNRRLSIDGDTEAGLHLKNLLDSHDYDWVAHVKAVLRIRI
jgi:O2-independent ubiquinone biosynthesis accessory factor UbiT